MIDVLFVNSDDDVHHFAVCLADVFQFGYLRRANGICEISRHPIPGSEFCHPAQADFPRGVADLDEDVLRRLPPFEPSHLAGLGHVDDWEPGRRIVARLSEWKARLGVLLVALVLMTLAGLWLRAALITWPLGGAAIRAAIGTSSAFCLGATLFIVTRLIAMLGGTRMRVGHEYGGLYSSAGVVGPSTIQKERISFFYVDAPGRHTPEGGRRLRLFVIAEAESSIILQTKRSRTTHELADTVLPFALELGRILDRPVRVSAELAALLRQA